MFKKFAALIATLCAFVALTALGVSTASAVLPKANVGGGTGILVDKDNVTASACTLTAIGYDQDDTLMGLTAGHCGPAGKAVFVEAAQGLGPVGEITFTHSDLDYAIVRFDSAKVNPVQTVGGVTIRGIRTQAPTFPEIGCKQGRTTATTCGITWFSDGSAHTSQICVLEGDSGSPVVVGDQLVGMVNAYYFVGCIGPEIGTNIKPILDDLPERGITEFRVV